MLSLSMDSSANSPSQSRSLIVKLRYKTACSKCTDMLSRWCAPGTDDLRRLYDAGTTMRLSLDDLEKTSAWTWKFSELRKSSTNCCSCGFLLTASTAIPGVQCRDNDYIRVKPQLVGSKHSTPYERAYDLWMYRIRSQYDQPEDKTTQYMRYYRPNLQIYQPVSDVVSRSINESKDNDTRVVDSDMYSLKAFSFLLPLADLGPSVPEAMGSVEAFVGRRINAQVDFALIRDWLNTCVSRHHGGNDSGSQCAPTSAYEERSADPYNCRSKDFSPLPGFRLIDVSKRCVMRVDSQPEPYAALSYVWGDAKRLLLTNDNEEWLCKPGVLSADNADLPRTFQDALILAENLFIKYLWIDALCICQDDPEQLQSHMDAMESVYSSAILTIVNDTGNADSGIFGVSQPRAPAQAMFTWGGTKYISARKTFGEALKDSPWEKRAWCLQEKVFSKRLLILTESQTFYHCGTATWFEDTVMEPKENISGAVHMRERVTPYQKGALGRPLLRYTAYESHRESFGRNFWSLVQAYSRRQMSFESDVVRAFTGILKSIETDFGRSVWGIPSKEFVRGLTWAHTTHRLNLRREGFPSWSWTAWKSDSDSELHFKNCKRTDADLWVSRGRYGVNLKPHDFIGPSVWTIHWYHHQADSKGNEFELIDKREPEALKHTRINMESEDPSDDDSDQEPVVTGRHKSILDAHCWHLPGHPRAHDESENLRETHTSQGFIWKVPLSEMVQEGIPESKASTINLPPLNYKPKLMPPLSHIIRFYTSVATVFIPADPDPGLSLSFEYSYSVFDEAKSLHRVCLPDSEEIIAVVDLDPAWKGKGQLHKVVYISRWCRSFAGEEKKDTTEYSTAHVKLHVMLIEDVDGWGEVKRRVQILDCVKLTDWRKAKPRWELVNLA